MPTTTTTTAISKAPRENQSKHGSCQSYQTRLGGAPQTMPHPSPSSPSRLFVHQQWLPVSVSDSASAHRQWPFNLPSSALTDPLKLPGFHNSGQQRATATGTATATATATTTTTTSLILRLCICISLAHLHSPLLSTSSTFYYTLGTESSSSLSLPCFSRWSIKVVHSSSG